MRISRQNIADYGFSYGRRDYSMEIRVVDIPRKKDIQEILKVIREVCKEVDKR